MSEKENAERNRRAIIAALMSDGLTREQAEAEESRRFQRALMRLFRR